MAERRMFAKTIIDSDAFLDMPLSAQSLYFHLAMRADDDGFVNNPKKIQRMIGASDDDCRLLIMKRFILTFESGVIVIKHWKIHNYIQKDRYKETLYTEEKNRLELDERNAYTEADKVACIQDVYKTDIQDSKEIVKDSIESVKDKSKKADSSSEFIKVKAGTKYSEFIKAIVDYLNKKAGTKYRANSEDTAKHIRARMAEKFTLDDFYTVIDKKCAEWIGTEWEKFLRPKTLFGTKFESYLNAKTTAQRRGANGVLLDERQDDDLDGIL